MDIPCELQELEKFNGQIGLVKFPKFESVARGALECVVIVMPPFSKGKERDPPKVTGVVI